MNTSLEILIKNFGGKWVALKPDTEQVLSSGKDIKRVYKEAQKKGVDIPTLFKVPSKYIPYIG
ncbi:hypothetical protein A2865_03635 [Candidatus Woesebacteria bacterium RIFCSPHIGHO2_01_FULL_39_17]|uniref:DUF5678 domain-containing protein n=2 Tax=Candidatus Woeseibacteriota TaxID=1752722 RepID=A0A0G0LRT9_9BACT|nr:MAG: hypothetical protein US72_C0007G0042 [Microgenomates group bacterium GW2011_GWC1_38_12]KKQ93757.1 MAG: hypothetical protein UT19_C0007G0001 [Candidatus Woesebacteria bacterium GW2011_GWB1_39_10b]OGM23623.1 MAG: hypothetical protein A2865_03635 [Candidatus Woesebacteria bacterium RIFCSPHIGHO2_01_FULL_39_17]OGM64358.1 MAG: hypothetical protein A3A52_05490 [Candidatus Woesebacteria bacterium RIFCSPLOWO2_01_FULL_39_14]